MIDYDMVTFISSPTSFLEKRHQPLAKPLSSRWYGAWYEGNPVIISLYLTSLHVSDIVLMSPYCLPVSVCRNLNQYLWKYEPWHDKTNKMSVRPVWSVSLCAQWVAKGPRFLHADSEYSDQTGRMPRLIWVFTGCTLTLLVLSCRGSLILLLLISPHC